MPTTIGFYWAPDKTFDASTDTEAWAPVLTETASSNTAYSGHLALSDLVNPPRLGSKYLLAVANPDMDVVTANDPDATGSTNSPPEVVNVVTHGFNPDPLGDNWTAFLNPFQIIGHDLSTTLTQGTVLQGSVQSYVPQWDSTSGWYEAIVSLAASEILPPPYSDIALLSAGLFLAQSAADAEIAAENIDAYITNPQNQLLLAPQYQQVIQLIGHSRGAAVNARVSQLLSQQGYTVADYISLDGYSTDWPYQSNVLGDISITGTATATTKVNYEVQQGLAGVQIQWLDTITGKPLTASDIAALTDAATNWKAPDREDFDNFVIPGTGVTDDPNQLSNHWNIVNLFTNGTDPLTGGLYLLEDAEGDLLQRSGAQTGSATSGAILADASPALSPSTNNFNNFTDGSFESVGSVWRQLQAANVNTSGSTVLASWLSMVDDPAKLLASEWNVTGNSQLIQDGAKTLAELDQTAGNTSIGQYLELDAQASTIGFDMSVLSASPGDQLQVLLNNNVLGTFDLSSLPSNGHYTVPLLGYASTNGEVTFQLVGPAGDAAKIQLDNLAVNEANSRVTFDPVLPQAVAAGTSLSMPITANDSNQGATLTYTLDPGAPSGVKIDPITGVLT